MHSLRIALLCVVVAVALLGRGERAAAGLACGRGVVVPGDTVREVLARCGPPSRRQSPDGKPRKGGSAGRGGAAREVWVYDLGPRQLVRYLIFERGRLRAIEVGNYGG